MTEHRHRRSHRSFTQKERDNETGLDYFLARYYSSTQGRFTSADEPLIGQDEDDPHVIETKYDVAGRMAGVKDQQSGIYYAGAVESDATNRMKYAAHGAVSVMKLGNGLWEHTDFNSRLQATQIGLGTSSTDSSTLGLTYNYGTTNNNGKSVEHLLIRGYSSIRRYPARFCNKPNSGSGSV